MRLAFYHRIKAAFAPNSLQQRDYAQIFLARSGYLLPVILMILIILWIKSIAIDNDRHNQYLAHLRQIQTLNARIDRNLLQARDGLLKNYDPIVNDLAQLKQLQTALQQMPSFVDDESRQKLDRLLKINISIWLHKEDSILRFQSQNAILINSLTYFPIAISGIVAKDSTPPILKDRLNNLLRDILLFNIDTDNTTLAVKIDREIREFLPALTSPTEENAIRMVLTHARIIFNRRALVNDAVETVIELPTAESSEKLALAYYLRYQQAIDTTNSYRLWFYLMSIGLLVGIASWIVLRIRRDATALAASEAKFLAAFRFAPYPLAITTIPDCTLIEVNDSFCRESGFTRAEAIGRNGLELNLYQNPEDRARILQILLKKGAIRHQEIEVRTKRNKIRTVLISAETIDLNGRDCFLVVSDDITDRKRIEVALREAKQAAEAANLAKSQFLANMSHELRTPLNIILGFTQLLARDSRHSSGAASLLVAQRQEYLDTIARSGEHLLDLINDVLEMSKIEAGRTILNETSFDLDRQIQTLADMWQPKAKAKGLQLTVLKQPDVPQSVFTDERKLRQVLMNLISNAIKFTATGGISLRVWVEQVSQRLKPPLVMQSPPSRTDRTNTRAEPLTETDWGHNDVDGKQHQRLCFEVEDTGVGIAPDEVVMLFDAFAQTESGRQSQQGTGLGLAISREFVRLMGGDLTLTTQLGQGTTFRFDLPLVNADTVEAVPLQSQQRAIGLVEGQHYRLLVVEDNRESRRLLVKMLETVGFEVQQAANGREAIDRWKSFDPHLIWMDLRMPVMDGYEATRQIRSHPLGREIIILALTASAFEEERPLAIAAGCDDFVRKPFREEELFSKMAHYLGVRYRYESFAKRPLWGIDPISIPAATPADLTAALLSIDRLPAEWRSQLHQAATQVDAEQILRSIDLIPPEYSPLALAIADLMNHYRFDRIVELTRSSPNHL
jgi:PAS domain S-box-containing protein